jgi:hypothetical protein
MSIAFKAQLQKFEGLCTVTPAGFIDASIELECHAVGQTGNSNYYVVTTECERVISRFPIPVNNFGANFSLLENQGIGLDLGDRRYAYIHPALVCALLEDLNLYASFGRRNPHKRHGAQICPECRAPGAYVGLLEVDCIHRFCKHFKEAK